MRILTDRDALALHHALHDVALFGRDDLQAILVTGQDRLKYLQAMLTQDVQGLEDFQVVPACLCDAQGKILSLMTLVKEPDRLWLWTEYQHAEALRDRLERYVIMNDAELVLQPDLAAMTLVGPQVPELTQKLGLPEPPPGKAMSATLAGISVQTWQTQTGNAQAEQVPERWLILPRADMPAVVDALVHAGAAIGCHAAVDALRILAGQPLLGKDVEDGTLPIEAGLQATVSYRKGCYVGQEAIAMMTYRGQLRRHLTWLEILEGSPQPGWQLRTPEGKRAGKMGSAVQLADATNGWKALGLGTVQRKCFQAGAELIASDESAESGENVARVRILATTTPGVFATPEAA